MNRKERMKAVHKDTQDFIETRIRKAESQQEAFDIAAAVLVTAAGFTGSVDNALALLVGLKGHK